jgi:hypothetical protein
MAYPDVAGFLDKGAIPVGIITFVACNINLQANLSKEMLYSSQVDEPV